MKVLMPGNDGSRDLRRPREEQISLAMPARIEAPP